MRAVAAFSILLLHTLAAAGRIGPTSFGHAYAARLEVGVRIFFVISGLVLFLPFVRAHLGDRPQPTAGPYAWRRVLRIVPAFWVALAVTAIWIPHMLTLRNAPFAFGFAQIYRSNTQGIGIFPAWSLCVEVTFYAFLPLYAAVVGRFARKPGRWLRAELAGLAVLAVVGIAWKWWALAGTGPRIATEWLPGWLDLFALGMGLAVLQAWRERSSSTSRPLALVDRFPVLPWLVAAVAYWYVSTRIGLADLGPFATWTRRQILEEYYLYALIALALMIPAAFGDPRHGLIRKVLGHRWIVWLGLISYGVYLWQSTWLAQLKLWNLTAAGSKGAGLWLVLGAAGSVILGAASYYIVERPALSLKRLVSEPRPVSVATPPEPAPAIDG